MTFRNVSRVYLRYRAYSVVLKSLKQDWKDQNIPNNILKKPFLKKNKEKGKTLRPTKYFDFNIFLTLSFSWGQK